jgi:phosphatidylserine/phosphatidylglycerophosphate/cardiolipin synthase-like enzyme
VSKEIAIAARANCDDVYVVWRYPAPVEECRGFALYRKAENGDVEPVQTFVPFSGESHESGEHRPSTEWPIQRFGWTDVFAQPGKTLSYRVVPMVGAAGSLKEAEDQASPWTDPIEVTASAGNGLSAYFNRGVLATQAMARRLKGEEPWTKKLAHMIETPEDPTRDFLSGELRLAMRRILAEVKANPEATLYAALFELDDPELIEDLEALGPRAHVILANGPKAKRDKSKEAREGLREAKVEVHDRMVEGGLAHNKFLVICDPDGSPRRVWTGSTNWSMTGLCTQVNNGILIDNEEVAIYYREYWDALLKAKSEFTKELTDGNDAKRAADLKGGTIGTWFTRVHDTVDLADARELIAAAKQGVLFLFFFPGRKETLFNAVMDRADPTSAHYDAELYVHGVVNQDPESGSKDESLIGLIHRGQLDEADPDIVLPSKVDKRFASWEEELLQLDIVKVHSKVIVLDPFGEKPVVMTGSHNLGPRASSKNDDNLNLIAGAPALAAAYATHIISVYNAYRWRYVRSQRAKDAGNDWDGPEDGKAWQEKYYGDEEGPPKQRELAFWLGER